MAPRLLDARPRKVIRGRSQNADPISKDGLTEGGQVVKFSRFIVASLVSAALLSGCGKSTAPTSVNSTSLDTTPPPTPSGLSVTIDASGVSKLIWSSSAAADLADYQL